jgi:hypothetical protein
MKQKHLFSIPSCLLLGLTVAGLVLTSPNVSATTLKFIGDESDFGEDSPPEWTDLNWTVEGKIGGNTWEIALEDGDYNVKNNQNFKWQDNQPVPWKLDWDQTKQKLTFELGSNSAFSYTADTTITDFTGFYLWTRATTQTNRVEADTKIDLKVTEINGMGVSASSSATAPLTSGTTTAITKNFFQSDTAIQSMEGEVLIDWPSFNPQSKNASSRIGFKIQGYSTPQFEFAPPSVPEPSALLGLLGIGTFGLSTGFKRK